MHPEPVKTEGMPIAIGPYSQVVRLGDLLFVSGQGGLDPETGSRVPAASAPRRARRSRTSLACWRPREAASARSPR